MPFGPYKDHADCVARNSGKKDPDAYCATVEREIAGKSENGDVLTDLPSDAQGLWFKAFQESMEKGLDGPASGKIAWATVYRRYEKSPAGWKPLKVFIESALFKSIYKADRIIYGAASVAIKDTDNDLITEDALRTAFNSYIERGHVLFFHRNVPVGEVLPAYETAGGDKLMSEVKNGQLNVVVRIYKDTNIANEVWAGIENGQLRAFSIGGEVIGQPVKVCEDSECKTYHNRIDQIDLHEISVVPEPANQAAYFGIVKSRVTPMEKTEPNPPEPPKPCGCSQKSDEDVAKIVSAALKIIDAQKAEHMGDCPKGHHMVDGKCVPEDEKSKSETKETKTVTDEPKTEPKPEEKPWEADIASLKGELGELKSLLTKALQPKEGSVEKPKETPAAPVVREKASVNTDTEKPGPSMLSDKYELPFGQTATWEGAFKKAASFSGIKEWS